MQPRVFHSITDIPAADWDALWTDAYPFTQHAFLAALESSGSINGVAARDTGWQALHVCIEHHGTVVAAMPLFLKMHSYGEYVFDWAWANAYQQAGVNYYPKLVNAIPFTPATGPRMAFANTLSTDEKTQAAHCLIDTIQQVADEHHCSGYHSLFPCHDNAEILRKHHLTQRLGAQFHWFNNAYRHFDDFLAQFSSRKRKNIRKERAKVHSSGLTLRMRDANAIEEDEWHDFYALYQRTYIKRSGHGGYLGQDFFQQLAQAMPTQVLLASAHDGDEMMAAAFYLRDEKHLYGRYWGAREDIDGLHFECCYYQGIDYAIAHQLERFDPGAQGEHKIQRGFTPVLTQSFHCITHPEFRRAIDDFLLREAPGVKAYVADARTYLPFKDEVHIVSKDILL